MRTDTDTSATTRPEEVWRGILMGTDPRFRKARALYKHLPREPRCKMCAVPFAGPMGTIMRMRGRGPWSKNPKYCGMCFSIMSNARGGAEIPCTLVGKGYSAATFAATGVALIGLAAVVLAGVVSGAW